jgi:hypothetical protein
MPNPRKRKAAIKMALDALDEAQAPEQQQAILEVTDSVTQASDSEVESTDWLLKKAEELAEAVATSATINIPPVPVTPVKNSVPPVKKKTTKKKGAKRGTKRRAKKATN